MNHKLFLQKIEEIGNLPYDKNTFNKVVGFRLNGDSEQTTMAYNSGRLNLLPLYLEPKVKAGYCLRIIPNERWENWPVYFMSPSGDAQIYLSKKELLVAFENYCRFISNAKKISYHEEMTEIRELIMPMIENCLGGGRLIRDVATSFMKLGPDIDYDWRLKETKQVQFLKENDNSKEHLYYRSVIEELLVDEGFDLDIDFEKLGIYSDRVNNILTTRIMRKSSLEKYEPTEHQIKIIWRTFKSVHGLNPMNYNANHGLGSTGDGKSTIKHICWFFTIRQQYEKSIPEFIEHHPLFQTIDVINEKETSYNGREHLHAAAIIDEQLDDPLLSFNTLCSAFYWAATTLPKSLPLIADKAVALCQKNKWEDAATAISWMLEKYRK